MTSASEVQKAMSAPVVLGKTDPLKELKKSATIKQKYFVQNNLSSSPNYFMVRVKIVPTAAKIEKIMSGNSLMKFASFI